MRNGASDNARKAQFNLIPGGTIIPPRYLAPGTYDVTFGSGPRSLHAALDIGRGPGRSATDRPDKVTILGPNGSRKTTLFRTFTGELAPDAGTIEKAEKLRIVYFEQNRESLDPTLTLKRALASEGDQVVYRDRTLHVASWAKRFLFRPEQLETLSPNSPAAKRRASSSPD